MSYFLSSFSLYSTLQALGLALTFAHHKASSKYLSEPAALILVVRTLARIAFSATQRAQYLQQALEAQESQQSVSRVGSSAGPATPGASGRELVGTQGHVSKHEEILQANVSPLIIS